MDDATALSERLASGETSAVEALTDCLAAIDAREEAINAFVSLDRDGAIAAARASDERRAAGRSLGPLDGVPIAVKDNLAVRGTVTTGGHAADGLAPDEADAEAVANLRAAGAVIVGKLNLHEGALGATTDNPHHGRTFNPLGEGLTPGGSSGGSGAAVAAGMVPIALGTDTMGSVRIPAAYCGTCGLKPTRGLVPVDGLVPLSPTLDTIGPLARSPRDLGLALDVMGSDGSGDPEWMPPAARHGRALAGAWKGLRVGIPTALDGVECEDAVLAAFDRACGAVTDLGGSLRSIALDGWDPSASRRAGLLVSEAEAALALGDAFEREPERYGEEFRGFVAYGASVSVTRLASGYGTIRRSGAAARAAFAECDVVLMPTAPQRAFPHGAEVPANQADLTALANFAGLPALALPVPSKDELPGSVQIVGPEWGERSLVALAEALAERLS